MTGRLNPFGGSEVMSTYLGRSIAMVSACALVAACSSGSNNADTTAMADTTASAVTTPPAAPALTDANIFALLDEANMGDSVVGNLASTKGTSASVKDFGKQMMRDHHALRKGGQDLAKKLNITPAPPANDTLPASVTKVMDSLTAKPKGAAWDKAYIDNEVAVHQSVQSLLQAAQGMAQDSSLKAAIGEALPMIQGHLLKAQDIQSKLGAADSTKKTP
jgi:putative membrane protein